jgi:predicted nucleic acid-binding protein
MAARVVVYDSGALIAAERDDPKFRAVHQRYVAESRRIIVPAPVLAQVWRGGSRQARMSWTLRGCVVEPTIEVVARYAGVLLGRSGTSDAIDAIVVASALTRDGVIVTSDPNDLDLIWRSAETGKPPALVTI